eukprot:362692_1
MFAWLYDQYWKTDKLYFYVYVLGELAVTIARVLLIWYFLCDFHFPWNVQYDYEEENNHAADQSCCICCCLIYIFIGDIVWCLQKVLRHPEGLNGWMIIAIILGRFFLWWPCYVSFGVHSAICWKFYLYLEELNFALATNENELRHIVDKYVELYDIFNREYPATSKWAIDLILFTFLSNLWLNTYSYNKLSTDWLGLMTDIVYVSGTVILYVMASSSLNSGFASFDKILCRYGLNGKVKQFDYYSYALHFVSKHQIRIKMGSIIVNELNAVKFLLDSSQQNY